MSFWKFSELGQIWMILEPVIAIFKETSSPNIQEFKFSRTQKLNYAILTTRPAVLELTR